MELVKSKKYPVVLEEHGERVVIRKVMDHGSEAFRIEYYVAGQRRGTRKMVGKLVGKLLNNSQTTQY